MKRVVPCLIVLFALSGCSSMEHTGMSVGGTYQVAPGFSVNTNQFFKKKKN